MRSPAAGHLYVLEVTDDITKIGYSDALAGRLGQHESDLQKEGRSILRRWVSLRHDEAFQNEVLLIDACIDQGGRQYKRRLEWFTGLSFSDVVAAAEKFPCTECVAPQVDPALRSARFPMTWPASMAEKVAAAAREHTMPIAVWVREAIREKLEREQS
jgi:predicted GIY-YIG superfamily endonuclease